MEFSLAQQVPNCNTSTGINRIDASSVTDYSSDGVAFFSSGVDETTLKDLSRWSDDEYFNIWIVTAIDGNNGGFGYQGYANFYSGFSYEGSAMMYTVFGHDPTNANPEWSLTIARDNSAVLYEVGYDQVTIVRAVLDNAAIVNSKGDEAIDSTCAAPTAVWVLNTGVDILVVAGIISVELNSKTVNFNTSGDDGGNLDQTNDCNEYF